jgi:hypothetical protein
LADGDRLIETLDLPETEERCACAPGRPCGLHWSALPDHQRRRIARDIGLTNDLGRHS